MTSQSTPPAANAELVRAAARAFNTGNTDECLARIAVGRPCPGSEQDGATSIARQ